MDFTKLNNSIPKPDAAASREALRRWNDIAKPVGGLGLLEDAIAQIAALEGTADVMIDKRAVVVLCADNGVVEEGVTQTGQEVTALVAGNMARGMASVSRMAAVARADVLPVDMGMRSPVSGVLDRRIAPGTRNITKGPAMTREEAARAIAAGIDLVDTLRKQEYDILATGEMGIGNTTTASAMASVLCELPAEITAGRGAGLSDAGLARKTEAIRRAVETNAPDARDALDVLSKLGGLDIAGMAGVFIGGALYRVPVLIDGFISAVAALTAVRLCPACAHAILATHVSAEPASERVLSSLHKAPLLCARMRLGEGTGAVCALPLLDMALAVYAGMPSFAQLGLTPYEVTPR